MPLLDLKTYADRLAQSGVVNAPREAENIVRHVLNLTDEALPLPAPLTVAPADQERIEALVSRREQRIPLERLTGLMTFEGVEIELNDKVFRPYPETGVMAQHAAVMLENNPNPLRILDLGTGTGCILLALLRMLPNATGIGLDTSADSIALANKNAVRNNLQDRAVFRLEDWTTDQHEKFDLVIANLPRVPSADIARLIPEMRDHDPHFALDGGTDGLSFFNTMLERFAFHAKQGGIGLFQSGPSQVAHVRDLFLRAGYKHAEIKENFFNQPICLLVLNEKKQRFAAIVSFLKRCKMLAS